MSWLIACVDNASEGEVLLSLTLTILFILYYFLDWFNIIECNLKLVSNLAGKALLAREMCK